MKKPTGQRQALRVAMVATAIGAICFILSVVIFDLVLVNHTVGQIDTRLTQRLTLAKHVEAKAPTSSIAPLNNDADNDDAPIFVWLVSSNKSTTPISGDTPDLPRTSWATGTRTLTIGRSTYRLSVIRFRSGWLVSGESLATERRLESTLYLAEIIAGAVLTVLMFIVAYVIGLRALAPVDHARRRQAEFVADASHELRTPLSVIEAEVEISLARQRSAGEYRSTLQRVGEEGRRLQYIVEDLLWLARHDEKVPKVDNAVLCDVASAAKSCVARFQGLATMNDISLTQTIDVTTNSFVHADPESIDRLLGVLVDNACKFAGSGGRVEVVVSSYPGRVILKVGDSGPGIEAAEQVAIFERFHHSDSTNGGTGLGLAIADSIITASDAQRRVGTSHLGGAEFEIVWPAEDF